MQTRTWDGNPETRTDSELDDKCGICGKKSQILHQFGVMMVCAKCANDKKIGNRELAAQKKLRVQKGGESK